MKSLLWLTTSEPLLVLTSHESLHDPKLRPASLLLLVDARFYTAFNAILP